MYIISFINNVFNLQLQVSYENKIKTLIQNMVKMTQWAKSHLNL